MLCCWISSFFAWVTWLLPLAILPVLIVMTITVIYGILNAKHPPKINVYDSEKTYQDPNSDCTSGNVLSELTFLGTNPGKVLLYCSPPGQQHKTFSTCIVTSVGGKHKFPSLDDNASIDLSVVIPAYNEENRLPSMLEETIEILEERAAQNSMFKYEMIIVDDGSKDTTTNVGLIYTKRLTSEKCRVLTLGK